MAYDWSQLGVKEITHLYLYGDLNTPSDLTSTDLLRPEGVPVPIRLKGSETNGTYLSFFG